MVEWNEENVAHLLRRAGFGARPKDIDKYTAKGMDATIESLFVPDKKKYKLKFGEETWLDDIQSWWLRRMVKTKAPLIEKLTLFWHNHFSTAFQKVEDAKMMYRQNKRLRNHSLGSFREMVHALARDEAMIVWLDNETNVVGNPNENFARELMELFTTGVLDKNGIPNYTEKDVKSAARAFTGWTLDDGKFMFAEWDHDFGTKKFKGVTQNYDGGDIIDLLVVDPATARRIAHKLFCFFAYEVELSDPVIDFLEQVYLDNDTQIQPVVEAIFRMEAFYSAQAMNARVKSPVEFLVGSIQMLGGKISSKKKFNWDIYDSFQVLGQPIFDPPSVFGWDEGMSWLAASGILGRTKVAEWVADSRKNDPWTTVLWDPKNLLPKNKKKWKDLTPADVVQRVTDRLGPLELQPTTRAALEHYLQTNKHGEVVNFKLDSATVNKKVRGLVALILSGPEYQFA